MMYRRFLPVALLLALAVVMMPTFAGAQELPSQDGSVRIRVDLVMDLERTNPAVAHFRMVEQDLGELTFSPGITPEGLTWASMKVLDLQEEARNVHQAMPIRLENARGGVMATVLDDLRESPVVERDGRRVRVYRMSFTLRQGNTGS